MNKKLQVDSDEVNLLMKNAHGQSVDLAGFEKYIKEKCKTARKWDITRGILPGGRFQLLTVDQKRLKN